MSRKLRLYDYDSDKIRNHCRHSTDLNSLIIIKMRPIKRLRRDEIEEFKLLKILFAYAKKHDYSITFGTHPNCGKEGISIIVSDINRNKFRQAMIMLKKIMKSFLRISVNKFIIIGWENRFNDEKRKIIFKD